MVDYGLICLFALQLGIVALTYHAYVRISSKISTLDGLRKEIDRVPSQLAPIEARIAKVEERMEGVAAAPAATKKRLDEADALVVDIGRQIAKLEKGLTAANARISVQARWNKRASAQDDDDETAPAAQAEGEEDEMFIPPPGAHHQQATPQAPALPQGFGVVKRRVGNG